jgi:hypothetical protein
LPSDVEITCQTPQLTAWHTRHFAQVKEFVDNPVIKMIMYVVLLLVKSLRFDCGLVVELVPLSKRPFLALGIVFLRQLNGMKTDIKSSPILGFFGTYVSILPFLDHKGKNVLSRPSLMQTTKMASQFVFSSFIFFQDVCVVFSFS